MDHNNNQDKFLSNSRLRGDQTEQTKAHYEIWPYLWIVFWIAWMSGWQSLYNHQKILSEKGQGLSILMMCVWNEEKSSLLSLHFLKKYISTVVLI
jgi:hypothetical protein